MSEDTPAKAANPPFGLEGAIATPTAAQAADAEALRAERDRLLVQLEAAGQPVQAALARTVRMKVEPPHASMTHGGVTVGSEFTDVPAWFAAALSEAATGAGVTLTQEG
jgi:hypothetical protein